MAQGSARWIPIVSRGHFLSPSGMPAASPQFRALSYLDLVACLLDAHAADNLTPQERQVMAGYLKTLQRRILRPEFNAILDMEGDHERIE